MLSLEWHARLRRSALSSWIIELKDFVDCLRCQRSGAERPLCPLKKRRAILHHLQTHDLHLVVETGTYLGDMAAFLLRRGYRVITIEIDAKLAAFARARFAGNKDVRLLQGDSGALVSAIVDEIEQPALFYLDAHYSGPGTGKGERDTPVTAEIGAILERAPARSFVVIDDARCFGTDPHYPPMAEFLASLRERGASDVTVANDAIIFTVPDAARRVRAAH